MVNKDILDALELLTHKGFSQKNKIKSIIRKVKNKHLINNKFIDKSILIVDETGDIIFDVIKFRPKKVDLHLKNNFSKYYIELKIAFIKENNYSKYVKFFVKTDHNNLLFNYDNYYKISMYLSEPTRLFWDALYENTNYNGTKIRNSDLFEQNDHNINNYPDEKFYNIVKNNISKIKFKYIEEIEDEKYDYLIIDSEINDIDNSLIELNICKKILL